MGRTDHVLQREISMTYHPDVLERTFVVEEIYRQTNGEANHFDRSRTASDVGCTAL